jgi:hypothetical protein
MAIVSFRAIDFYTVDSQSGRIDLNGSLYAEEASGTRATHIWQSI